MESSSGDDKSIATHPFTSQMTLLQWNNFWFRSTFLNGVQAMTTKFKPLPSDVIMASFPKTGTTWLKALLYSISSRSNPKALSLITTHNPHMLVPQIEFNICGLHNFTSFPSTSLNRRVIATHIPYQILEDNVYSSDCRIIYIARNPKDTLVSSWKFLPKIEAKIEEELNLEYFVNNFCDGTISFGPYYDHVLGYWKKSVEAPEKVFFLTYEELQKDPIIHVKRLGEFMNCPFKNDEEIGKIVRMCSIKELKNHEINKSSFTDFNMIKAPNESFFREGKVGGYMNYLSSEMIDRIDSLTKARFHDSGFFYGLN